MAGPAVADFERLKAAEEERTVDDLLQKEYRLLEEILALGGKAEEYAESRAHRGAPAPTRA